MRKNYNSPWMEVDVLEEEDVIVCSAGEGNTSQDPDEDEDWFTNP